MQPRTVDTAEREHRRALAADLVEDLLEQDVVAVALTRVDHSGITRVKSVPLAGLPRAAADGVGASPVFDVFLLDDTVVPGRHAGGPVGDLRLRPDLDRLTVPAAQPGWARAVADRLAVHGYAVQAGFEVEWVVGQGGTDESRPATTGPAYGHARQVELSDYAADLLSALAEQDVDVLRFHPEHAPGQFEVSTIPEEPVHAADTSVLVRETIRAITLRHGMRASFSPKVTADGVGNGGHLHLSLWRDGRTLFDGGEGWFGLTEDAEAFAAGVLRRLPALCAIGSPSVAGYLRLVPRHWAGAFAASGLENREAALRLVAGRDLEVRCCDLSANPYLAVATTMAAGLAGSWTTSGCRNRSGWTRSRCPTSGAEFAATIVDVRRGEVARFADCSPEEIAALTRWRR